MKADCSIFFHNYYGSSRDWIDFFSKNISVPFNIYYNLVEDSIYNTDLSVNNYHQNTSQLGGLNNTTNQVFFRKSSNKGKDIGGKMVLLDTYIKLNLTTEFGLFLHDKKSLYKANNKAWADKLLKIAGESFSQKVQTIFQNKPAIGLITASGNVMDEYNAASESFVSTNAKLLPQLQQQFNINPPGFNYIAGTMFWFRMKPIENFFKKYPPLIIRETLEDGNVTDEYTATNTHCWERLLSWIITAEGYKINTL